MIESQPVYVVSGHQLLILVTKYFLGTIVLVEVVMAHPFFCICRPGPEPDEVSDYCCRLRNGPSSRMPGFSVLFCIDHFSWEEIPAFTSYMT